MDREMLEAGAIRRNVEMFLEAKLSFYADHHRSAWFDMDWHYDHWQNIDSMIFAVFNVSEDRAYRYQSVIDNLKMLARDCSKDYVDYTIIDFAVWLDNNAKNLTHYILYGKEF